MESVLWSSGVNCPFHPKHFMTFLQGDFPDNVIRSKGLFWIAEQPNEAMNFSQAEESR